MEIIFLIGRILFGGYFLMGGINHFTKKEMMKGYVTGSFIEIVLRMPKSAFVELFLVFSKQEDLPLMSYLSSF